MFDKIREILDDLYLIDKDLKKYEQDLIKAIEQIIASRPEVDFSPEFSYKLKEKLLLEFSDKVRKKDKFLLFNNIIFMKKIVFFAVAGVFLIFLALMPIFSDFNYFKKAPDNMAVNLKDSTSLKISKIGTRGFGLLIAGTSNAENAQNFKGSSSDINYQPLASGAGGQSSLLPSSPIMSSEVGVFVDSKTSVDGMIMPPIDLVNYKYIYKGEDFDIGSEKMEVLRRVRGVSDISQVSGLLPELGLGMISLPGFDQLTMQNTSFVQNKPYGYYVNVSLEEGGISLYQNWNYWPQSICQDETCFNSERLTEKDLLSDEETIAITDGFIKNHGISLVNFSKPEVLSNQNNIYFSGAESSEFRYVSEYINVVYPLIINGKTIYEQDGNSKVGLTLSVNIKEKKVSSVYNLYTQSYQSSEYEVEDDFNKIKSIVENGGIYNWNYPEATKTVEVEVGNPKLEYIKFWQYTNNRSEELLIPALIFPVINNNIESGYFYRNNIVVPLVKDILDNQNNGVALPFKGVMGSTIDSVPSPNIDSTVSSVVR